MNKEQVLKGLMWLSWMVLCIMISATFLFSGFNNVSNGSYILLVLGLLFIPLIFFCAYKGFKLISDSIFY